MGLKLSSLKLDEKLVEKGVWVSLEDDAQILVAKQGNANHRKLVQQLRKPYRSFEVVGRDLPDDVARRIGIEATARTILLGWKNILDDDGSEIPFTYENAIKALSIEGFMSRVLNYAADENLFKGGVTHEEEVKNSETSSTGSSSTAEAD